MLTNFMIGFIGAVCVGNLVISICNLAHNRTMEHELDFLENENERMRLSLDQAADWFDDYAIQHHAKNTTESTLKAHVNEERAAFCREAAK